MVIFSQSMVELYAKQGIEIPNKMTHKEFRFFLECHKRAHNS